MNPFESDDADVVGKGAGNPFEDEEDVALSGTPPNTNPFEDDNNDIGGGPQPTNPFDEPEAAREISNSNPFQSDEIGTDDGTSGGRHGSVHDSGAPSSSTNPFDDAPELPRKVSRRGSEAKAGGGEGSPDAPMVMDVVSSSSAPSRDRSATVGSVDTGARGDELEREQQYETAKPLSASSQLDVTASGAPQGPTERERSGSAPSAAKAGMVMATKSFRNLKMRLAGLGVISDGSDSEGERSGKDQNPGLNAGDTKRATGGGSRLKPQRKTVKAAKASQGSRQSSFFAKEDGNDIEKKMQAEAVREVMMMLPSVEVLRFLPKLKATINARVTSTESELHMMARSQVEEAHAVLSLLSESKNTSDSLNAASSELVDILSGNASVFIEKDPKNLMTQLSSSTTSLRKVIELCDAILTFPYVAEEVEGMIEDEDDLIAAHEALVGLHFHAEALDRAAVMSIKGEHNTSVSQSTADSSPFADYEEGDKQYEVVKTFLKRLSKTNAIFEERLFDVFTRLDDVAKAEPALLVRALRIIEKQQIIDSRLPNMKKNYREKAMTTIKESLKIKFDILTTTLKTKDSDVIIELLESMTVGLTNTYDFVVPCFPENYRIFEMILAEFDAYYMSMFGSFCDDGGDSRAARHSAANVGEDMALGVAPLCTPGVDMYESFSNGDIKRLLMWLRDYQDQQMSLGIEKSLLGRVLDEERLPELLRFDKRRRVLRQARSTPENGGGGGGGGAAVGKGDGMGGDGMGGGDGSDGGNFSDGGDSHRGEDDSAEAAQSRDQRRASMAEVTTMSIDDILSPNANADAGSSGVGGAVEKLQQGAGTDSESEHGFEIRGGGLRAARAMAPFDHQHFSVAEEGVLTMICVYVERMQELLNKWFNNLLAIDSGSIPKRSETTGKLYTPASVEIFGIIDDQIAVVTDADRSWWLYKVIDVVLEVMDSFQTTFHARLEMLEEQGFENCIAGINNAVRCYEYAQDLSEHIEQILPDYLFDLLDFESTYTNFLNTAKDGIPMVSNCIFKDAGFLQVLKRLFKGDDWYRGDVMEIIIATLKDYCDDVSSFVEDILRARLMEAILERVVGVTFEMLLANCKTCLKDRAIETINRMELDSSLLRDFFSKYMEMDKLERTVGPLDSLRELVAAEDFGDVIMSYTLILQAKPNFQPQHVETLLSSRSDITKKERAELLEQCDERWQSSLLPGGGIDENGVSENSKHCRFQTEQSKQRKQRLKQKMMSVGKVSLLSRVKPL